MRSFMQLCIAATVGEIGILGKYDKRAQPSLFRTDPIGYAPVPLTVIDR